MDEWRKDHCARLRAEADRFHEMAQGQRADAMRFRKGRNFLEAMKADSNARDYRRSRDQRRADAKRVAAGGVL